MDRVVSSTFLMLILTMISCAAAEKDPKCEGVNKTLPREDLHKIFGDWVLVWSVTNIPNGWDLYNYTSSHLHLSLQPDNKTVVYLEKNLLANSSCHIWKVNLLADHADAEQHVLNITSATVDYDGHVVVIIQTGHLYLYKSSSPNELIVVYINQEGSFLLIYHRKGQVLKVDHKQHQERAVCMGFPLDHPFIYDGVSELCHECDHKMKNLPREDLHKIFGDWVLVWSVTNIPNGWNLYNYTSSHLHLSLQPDNKTVVYLEKNLLANSSCHIWKVNTLADHADAERHVLNITSATVDYDGHVVVIIQTGHLYLYKSDSPNELILVYTNQEGSFLLIYHRKGEVLKVDHKQQEDRAACLGIPVKHPFVYDEVTPLCGKEEG